VAADDGVPDEGAVVAGKLVAVARRHCLILLKIEIVEAVEKERLPKVVVTLRRPTRVKAARSRKPFFDAIRANRASAIKRLSLASPVLVAD
jgi:hypothetical protein